MRLYADGATCEDPLPVAAVRRFHARLSADADGNAAAVLQAQLPDLPPCDQVGFVVRDLQAAMAMYAPLFGPFTTMDGSVEQAITGARTTPGCRSPSGAAASSRSS
ncbi:MAG: hypothetical protein IPM40_12920 [Gammaproteobacteria bacterium]|nr:hypothetical protein [Gammaproteobacteria bacterium]